MTARIGLCAVTLLLTLPVRAEIVDIKWTGSEFSHSANIAPKKFLEICGKLEKGTSIAWRFKGGTESDFNIHYHVGKDVIYPENRKNIASAEGVLAVAQDQDYCWMWTNRGAQGISMEMSLSRGAESQKK